MDIISEILKRLLDSLSGAGYIIVCIGAVVMVIGWTYLSAKKGEKRHLAQRLLFSAFVILIMVIALVVNDLLPRKHFPKDAIGVIVVRIKNDDPLHSLQDKIISSINSEIRDSTQKIEVWATDDSIDEEDGLESAHVKARTIGNSYHATIVVWGTKADSAFFPRITVVDPSVNTIALNNTLKLQDVASVNLPIEIISKPLLLAHFVTGFLAYHGGRFDAALEQFDDASASANLDSQEIAEIYYYAGACHAFMGQDLDSRSQDPSQEIKAMLDNFEKADAVYVRSKDSKGHGRMQLLLAKVYLSIPSPTYLKKSIDCFNNSLTLLGGYSSVQDKAELESNLGDAYSMLYMSTGDLSLTPKAVDSYNIAVKTFTESAFPLPWAWIQFHLGLLYKHASGESPSYRLEEALAFFQNSLKVYSETTTPREWGESQYQTGLIYSALETKDRLECLEQEIKALEGASHVFTAQSDPDKWGEIEFAIGFAYQHIYQLDKNTDASLQCAIAAYSKALQTEKAASHTWGNTQLLLGLAYFDSKTGDRRDNLSRAHSCISNSLTVLTSKTDPKLYSVGTQALPYIDKLLHEGGGQ